MILWTLARSYHMEITKYSKQLKSTTSLSFRLTYLKAEMSTSICLFHFRFDILWSMSQSYLEYKLNEFNWHAKYKRKKSYRKKFKKKKIGFYLCLVPSTNHPNHTADIIGNCFNICNWSHVWQYLTKQAKLGKRKGQQYHSLQLIQKPVHWVKCK